MLEMLKGHLGKFVLATLSLALSACASFRVYEEPQEEPRSLVQVANYSNANLEVFVYSSAQCDEASDLGRLASVPPREQNKAITPRAIAAGQRLSFCIDVYDYKGDNFVCRRGLSLVADAAKDYRIEYRAAGNSCGTAALKTVPTNYFQN
jgi:hypothetical protein